MLTTQQGADQRGAQPYISTVFHVIVCIITTETIIVGFIHANVVQIAFDRDRRVKNFF